MNTTAVVSAVKEYTRLGLELGEAMEKLTQVQLWIKNITDRQSAVKEELFNTIGQQTSITLIVEIEPERVAEVRVRSGYTGANAVDICAPVQVIR